MTQINWKNGAIRKNVYKTLSALYSRSLCVHACVCACMTYIEKDHAGLLKSRNFHHSAQNDRVPPQFVI